MNNDINQNNYDPDSEQGLIIVHTGPGKGKTTAALGLCFRALGHNQSSAVIQFTKGKQDTGEIKAAVNFTDEKIQIYPMGKQGFIKENPQTQDQVDCEQALLKAEQLLKDSSYHIIVLDEINIALSKKLLTVEQVQDLLKNKGASKNVILTGRKAPQELIQLADTVTTFDNKKHHFAKGISARKGIEF